MKKILITLVFLLTCSVVFAQANKTMVRETYGDPTLVQDREYFYNYDVFYKTFDIFVGFHFKDDGILGAIVIWGKLDQVLRILTQERLSTPTEFPTVYYFQGQRWEVSPYKDGKYLIIITQDNEN